MCLRHFPDGSEAFPVRFGVSLGEATQLSEHTPQSFLICKYDRSCASLRSEPA